MAKTTASNPCVNRGGNYNNDGTDYPASNRDNKVDNYNDDIGFRVTL